MWPPPEKGPVPPASGHRSPIRNVNYRPSTHAAPHRQQPGKNFSVGAVVAALRDDGALPIRRRLLALAAARRLRFGGELPYDQQQALRRISTQRRRQLEAAARRFGVRP
jgi:hypothetical protein